MPRLSLSIHPTYVAHCTDRALGRDGHPYSRLTVTKGTNASLEGQLFEQTAANGTQYRLAK
jgi:hypothetical protein